MLPALVDERQREQWRERQQRRRIREALDLAIISIEFNPDRVWRAVALGWLQRDGSIRSDGRVDEADLDAAIEAHGEPTREMIAVHAALLLRERIEQLEAIVTRDVLGELSGGSVILK